MQSTKVDLFQTVWEEAGKLSDPWVRFYTLVWIIEKLRPTEARQRKKCLGVIADLQLQVPHEHREEALFQMAWKLPGVNEAFAEEALVELFKKPSNNATNWTAIAEAFAPVNHKLALSAAERQSDFTNRTRALITISHHSDRTSAKKALEQAVIYLDQQTPSFLTAQGYAELAREFARIDQAATLRLLRKALDFDLKEERVIDACALSLQIGEVASTIDANMANLALNRAVKLAQQIGDPRRSPHWLDEAGKSSELKFLLAIAKAFGNLSTDMELATLKKACTAARDLDLEEFCENVVQIAVEASRIGAPALAKELIEKAARQVALSEPDRQSGSYASCLVSLTIACAYANEKGFGEMLDSCMSVLDGLTPSLSFYLLQKLALGVKEIKCLETSRILRDIVQTAKQIESRSDRAIALAQAAETSCRELSHKECLALATEAIEIAIHIDNLSRRCTALLSIVAASRKIAPAHAKHAYEEAVHAAISLEPKLVRALMQDFVDGASANPIAACKLASRLSEEIDKCTLLAGIATNMRAHADSSADIGRVTVA